MNRSAVFAVGGGVAILLALTGCGAATAPSEAPSTPAEVMSQDAMEKGTASKEAAEKDAVDEGATEKGAMAPAGSYITYDQYQQNPKKYASGDVVLFFNATWCPTCQEATGNLESSTIPDGLTIVSVDYDSHDALKQQYGVTTQHTFVQVAPDGGEVAKFTGSTTVDDIEEQLS